MNNNLIELRVSNLAEAKKAKTAPQANRFATNKDLGGKPDRKRPYEPTNRVWKCLEPRPRCLSSMMSLWTTISVMEMVRSPNRFANKDRGLGSCGQL